MLRHVVLGHSETRDDFPDIERRLQEQADDTKPRVLAECAKRDDTVGPALEDRKGTLTIAQRKAWRQDLRLPRCCHGSSAYNLRITRRARQARATRTRRHLRVRSIACESCRERSGFRGFARCRTARRELISSLARLRLGPTSMWLRLARWQYLLPALCVGEPSRTARKTRLGCEDSSRSRRLAAVPAAATAFPVFAFRRRSLR